MTRTPRQERDDPKACCAAAYESEWARLLLGDSFHPGGIELTLHLGRLLKLGPESQVLDVACGRGSSAIALAKAFGCSVHGIDLSGENIREARGAAESEGVARLVSFEVGDAEQLPLPDGAFDAVICECAFCTFPSKNIAASEFARVLRPSGKVGLTDITCDGKLPPELDTLLGWIVCLADARPLDEYQALLAEAGFVGLASQAHNDAVANLASRVKFKLLAVEIAARLGKAPVPLDEVIEAKRLTKSAIASIHDGVLGYGLVVGSKRAGSRACTTS